MKRPGLFVGSLLSAVLLSLGCVAAENGVASKSNMAVEKAADKSSIITVAVDPRVELVAVTQHLSGYANGQRTKGRINNFDYPYLNKIRQHFAAFQEHASIKQLKELHIGGSDPMGIAVQLSEPDDLSFPAPIDRSILNTENAEAYADGLRSFAKAANFMAFFEANKTVYDAITDDFKRKLDVQAIATQTQSYCGAQPARFTVVLAPLLGRTAFGPSAPAPGNTRVFYAILPAQGVVDGRLDFGDIGIIGDTICHEFGHSFINPLVDKNWDDLAKYSALMEKIKYKKGTNYGREWKIAVCESVVRAVTARIILKQKGEAAYAEQLSKEKQSGFIFIDDLCRSLETYEKNRNQYQSLDSYFPELVRVFDQLQNQAG